MPTKLGDLDLTSRTADASAGTISEMRSISQIKMEIARKVEQRTVPDEKGSETTKDTGKKATVVVIDGDIVGENAPDTIAKLRKKYKEGKALELVSDLSLVGGTRKVVVEELVIETTQPYHFSYSMRLKESAEI